MENIEVVQSLPYLLQGTLVTLRIVAWPRLGLCMGLPGSGQAMVLPPCRGW